LVSTGTCIGGEKSYLPLGWLWFSGMAAIK